MNDDTDNTIKDLKDDLVKKITEVQPDKQIQTGEYLSRQGGILDSILKDEIYIVSAGGAGKAPMLFMSMNQAGILLDGSDLNISGIERIAAGELKKERAGEDHSSSEVFRRVVNEKEAFVLQRRSVDTALIIGLDRAKSILGLSATPMLSAAQRELSPNQYHFNQLVQAYVDNPHKTAAVSLSPDGMLSLKISDIALTKLQDTMDEYGLTSDQLIEHIRNNFAKPSDFELS